LRWFKDLKIRTKLLVGFLLVAILGTTIGVVGYLGQSRIGKSLDEVGNKYMVAIESLATIFRGQLEVAVGIRGLINPMFDLEKIRGSSRWKRG